MLSKAQKKFVAKVLPPHGNVFVFGKDDEHKLKPSIDYVVISGAFLNQHPNVSQLFKDIADRVHDRTRVLIVLDRFRGKFSMRDVNTFLRSSDYEVVTGGRTFYYKYVMARPMAFREKASSVSVIVPARNEKGNIEPIVKRLPKLGTHMEIVFVEGGSTDGTGDEVKRIIKKYPNRDIKLLVQSKKGKGNAVYEGFEAAKGEVVVILDSDLAIPPEEMVDVYRAFETDKGEFINCSRLVYAMPRGAMPRLNEWGNRFFAFAYGWLLGQKRKDLFAGTKMFRKSDYERMAKLRPYLGTDDKWGDLDLLLGAAKLGLKIQDFPVHYYPRVYGTSNMNSNTFLVYLIKAYLITIRKMKPGLRLPF
jgi:GT2 family glycosyltransferase